MTIISGFSDAVPGGDAGTPKTGSLATAITAGSTNATIRLTNTGDYPCSFSWRDTGTTTWYQKSPAPVESGDINIARTAARAFEYFLDASTIKIDVVEFYGTGLTQSTVTVADIRTSLLGATYSTDDISDATIQEYIGLINNRVTKAVERHLRISGATLDDSTKIDAVKCGTTWMVLMEIHNKGMSRGLEAQSPRVSLQTAKDFQNLYIDMLNRINSGIHYT